MPVYSSGWVHASVVKALAQLGLGRKAAQRFERDPSGALDVKALRRSLEQLAGAPAVLIGNAGDVNTGSFDDIVVLADLAEEFGAWLHVDGAFGLFARCSQRVAALARGIERAHSIASDCHKWLNVPYDCGVAFVADKRLLTRANKLVAAYLPREGGPGLTGTVFSNLACESSRRARGFMVWAALLALGREGVRSLVDRALDRARELAALVDAAPDLERLGPAPLNIVCFRAHPVGARRRDLDDLNERVAREVLQDGRVFVGSTRYAGRVALRAAFVNPLTTADDVGLLVDAVRSALRSCMPLEPPTDLAAIRSVRRTKNVVQMALLRQDGKEVQRGAEAGCREQPPRIAAQEREPNEQGDVADVDRVARARKRSTRDQSCGCAVRHDGGPCTQ